MAKIIRSGKSHETQHEIINDLHVAAEFHIKYNDSGPSVGNSPALIFIVKCIDLILMLLLTFSVQTLMEHFLESRLQQTLDCCKFPCILDVSSLSGQKGNGLNTTLCETWFNVQVLFFTHEINA